MAFSAPCPWAARGLGKALTLSLALVPALLGCGHSGSGGSATPAPQTVGGAPASTALPAASPASSAGPAVPDEPSVPLIDEKDLARVLEGLRGKVVLVDFWATWCAACVENFPHTVALYRRWSPQGLAVVAVSMDEPEDAPQVRKFLAGQKVGFLNFQSKLGGSSDEAIARFEIRDGTLPHLRLYDRAGKLRHIFPSKEAGKLEPEAIERAVQTLLEEQPAQPLKG